MKRVIGLVSEANTFPNLQDSLPEDGRGGTSHENNQARGTHFLEMAE